MARTDWNSIKAEYIQGGKSYTDLCEKYGISRSTLSKRARKEGWTSLRTKANKKIEDKMVAAVGKKTNSINSSYYKLVEKLFKKAEKIIDETPVWSVPALKEMAMAMRYLKECNDVKSLADIREQEARIKKLEKDIENGSKGSEIRVIMSSDAEKYGK